MQVNLACICLQARDELRAHLLGALVEFFLLEHFEHGEPRGAGERRARERAAEAADHRCVHDLRLADHRRQRHAARDALGDRHEIGLDARVFDRERLAGAREAGLDFIGDEQDAVFVAQRAQARAGIPAARCRSRLRPARAR